ncbi:hypothetical protein [Celeribacter sp. SCSIO 80788]|uniref:hypothetical protein n=1 Tax=Celeribacter sp. SCSIO 80788 TaxID=3117013 RepID=UPI003DA61C01
MIPVFILSPSERIEHHRRAIERDRAAHRCTRNKERVWRLMVARIAAKGGA